MKNIKKNILKLMGIAAVSAPLVFSTISCGENKNAIQVNHGTHHLLDHKAKRSTDAQILAKGNSWENRLDDFTGPIIHTWYADETNTIADMLEQMNYQVGFFFKRRIETMEPFEMCKYLVDIYNNNNGGNMSFKIVYKDKEEVVSINFENTLKEIIASLDLATPAINVHASKKLDETNPGTIGTMIAKKAGHSGDTLSWLLGLFLNIGADVFGVENPLELGAQNAKSHRAVEIMKLIYSLPSETIDRFTGLIKIFDDMAGIFKNSPLANQWASDHGLSETYKGLEHVMVKGIIGSGI